MACALALCIGTTTGEPFSGFAGRWRGAGTVAIEDGSHETIRCRADYLPGSAAGSLHMDVTCASDSYRVNIVADVQARGGSFSGAWQETTRQIRGDVDGTLPRLGQMQASLQTLGGGLQLGATADGRRQAITLRAQGTEVRGADIVLTRIHQEAGQDRFCRRRASPDLSQTEMEARRLRLRSQLRLGSASRKTLGKPMRLLTS